ncbi:MAG: phosphatidylserine decarboxylase family protein [Crocinitomicaceae bacterium]|nr:phosphatidylserine decarboxylase family protein [Crocinitomicaceae bacterium]|tara:strand:+ start:9304 stop:9972 length:669 start_codon:yes stop_codon:yes gene_type:complete
MTLHKEGTPSILIALVLFIGLGLVAELAVKDILIVRCLLWALGTFLLVVMLQFFRKPDRSIPQLDATKVFAPCDGKVVVIENATESEYFKDERIQVSIFMSPVNVHINWLPISGIIKYMKYHPGKYLVAWDPKSSTDNERTTVVVENDNGLSLLLRQIAGALARRIVCYAKEGDKMEQGSEMGFIKFGSRVDIFFPLGTEIKVDLEQKVKGNRTVLAEIPAN